MVYLKQRFSQIWILYLKPLHLLSAKQLTIKHSYQACPAPTQKIKKNGNEVHTFKHSLSLSFTDTNTRFLRRWLGIILRFPDQNGVSLLYIMLEIHHSGWDPRYTKLSIQQLLEKQQQQDVEMVQGRRGQISFWSFHFDAKNRHNDIRIFGLNSFNIMLNLMWRVQNLVWKWSKLVCPVC